MRPPAGRNVLESPRNTHTHNAEPVSPRGQDAGLLLRGSLVIRGLPGTTAGNEVTPQCGSSASRLHGAGPAPTPSTGPPASGLPPASEAAVSAVASHWLLPSLRHVPAKAIATVHCHQLRQVRARQLDCHRGPRRSCHGHQLCPRLRLAPGSLPQTPSPSPGLALPSGPGSSVTTAGPRCSFSPRKSSGVHRQCRAFFSYRRQSSFSRGTGLS